MSARANPRATGPTLTPAGSLAARPVGWQRGEVSAEKSTDQTPEHHPSPSSTPERTP